MTLLAIVGPTASGKTAVSLELAKLIDIEIISADSRQIYKHLDIGTAKPTKDELKKVKHHFIDIVEPDEYYSAGLFGNQADVIANQIFSRKKIPVLVGGSGLYIKALCEGLFDEDASEIRDSIRKELSDRLTREGSVKLYEELGKVDNDSAKLYSDKNPRRILRALEYFYLTGKPLTKAHSEKKTDKNFKTKYFGIYFEREELYKRINVRAEQMWEMGLIKETEKVLKMGYSPGLNSLNTVGYKECISYINGVLSKDEAIELTKRNTRRYAKRQMTWFRKNKYIEWLSNDSKEIARIIVRSIL